MAHRAPNIDPTIDHVEDVRQMSPSADYGLKNDDGFDPSKYDFYNPSYRTAGKAFVVQLDEKQSAPYTRSHDHRQHSNDPYEDDFPSPLSPIEELDDDPMAAPPRRSSDPGPVLSPSIVELEPEEQKPEQEPEEQKPDEYNLTDPQPEPEKVREVIHPLEQRSELLFSRQHLQLILADLKLSLKFTEFLRLYRPDSVPILAYYLDVMKALKTLKYAESIINGLAPIPGHEFTAGTSNATMAWVLEDKADRALDILANDDLAAFIAYVYVQTVDVALIDRVTGKEDPKLPEIADGLAEVFVLSDPARPDNPIVFTSEEFHRMTGYSRNEFLGRNCRLLGGPKTSPFGISRFRASLDHEREHCEVLLNYRKDGTPFINLIMCVPLRDQAGKVRYYLGAQLDITDLVSECTGLQSLKRLMQRHTDHRNLVKTSDLPVETIDHDEFEQLSETFNPNELEKLLKLRQREQAETEENVVQKDSAEEREKRASLATPIANLDSTFQINGEASAPPLGYYKTYLLVRPAPSLRILFASPDLRMPGVLQSPLLNRIGGSARVRDNLAHALEVGRKVTAKVQWLSKTAPKSRARWIHCTPLLGANDVVGVWMVILVDDEDEKDSKPESPEVEPPSNIRSGSSYTAEAIPWATNKQKPNAMGVSTTIWSEGEDAHKRREDTVKPKPRKPLYHQPSDIAEPAQPQTVIRPGPKIAGKAYSYTSSNEEPVSTGGRPSLGGDRSRPSSSSSSVLTPMQTSMQPKVRIAGRLSSEGENTRKPPVNMPYRPSVDGRTGDTMPVRRTYKSLSPYGVLFQD